MSRRFLIFFPLQIKDGGNEWQKLLSRQSRTSATFSTMGHETARHRVEAVTAFCAQVEITMSLYLLTHYHSITFQKQTLKILSKNYGMIFGKFDFSMQANLI